MDSTGRGGNRWHIRGVSPVLDVFQDEINIGKGV
jgi:hypothetical protein